MNKIYHFRKHFLAACTLMLALPQVMHAQFNFNAGNCTQVIGDNVSGVSVTVVNIPNGDGRYSGIQIYYNPVGTNQHAWFRNGETCSNVFVDEVPQGDLGFTINATYNGTIGQGAANNGTNTATYMFSTPLNAGQVLSWNVTAWATEANTNAYVMGGGNRVNVTIGGCQDNDAPTMGAATLVRAGKSKVVLNLSATDDICVTRYQITGNINGTPVDMTVPAPGCGAAGEVTFNLPVEITGTHQLTIRAIDGTGKQSANIRTVNVTANTTGPTNVQATFGSSTPSSITLNNVSATPGTGGAVVAYKVTYGPNNEYSQTIVPNGNQLTVSALKKGTN
ncbi:MAG: hypothetical protein J6Z12_02190, partial [Paludibacteraceae bacterium]|nr:hypothetical protein [Paludibacteraceae bacterium]